ncbi:unnamed protein product [Prorocentrum cordatum]|uniref:Uncharacterized protein n=1 Tax=Prorocentrum cordatum TaxID=2364126 RepID=A0ABN9V1E0_9DINO|nr:unnamed protein product [Polarella glacialis]
MPTTLLEPAPRATALPVGMQAARGQRIPQHVIEFGLAQCDYSNWRQVRGPFSAARLSPERVVSVVTDGRIWKTHEGVDIGVFDFAQVDIDADAVDMGYVASVIVDGQWSPRRKYECGMALDDERLLRGEAGTLLHRHCCCIGWLGELQLPSKMRDLQMRADLPEAKVLLERAQRPLSTGLAPSEASTGARGAAAGLADMKTACRWGLSWTSTAGALSTAGGAAVRGAAHHRHRGQQLALAGLTDHGSAKTASFGHARSRLWRKGRRLPHEFGGSCEAGLTMRNVPARQSRRSVVDGGRITHRSWHSNQFAYKAAKSAAAHGRLPPDARRKLFKANKPVEGAAMWVSAVDTALGGRDVTRRAAKPNQPAPGAAAAAAAAAPRLLCDLRGPEGKRRCARCRWAERLGEYPISIVQAALAHDSVLEESGAQVPSPGRDQAVGRCGLVRDLPMIACLGCGATGAARSGSFKHARGPPSLKGKSALSRLGKSLRPCVPQKIVEELLELG